jgi:cation:H+ antiporter
MNIIKLLIYVFSFFVLWFGGGLIIKGVDEFSKKINLSSFSVSFFVLGILTSVPEFALGINSILIGDPEIFVGNLIGGSVTLLLLVIPTLAILGGGIKLYHQLDEKNLIFSLLVVITPVFFIADNLVTRTEGVFLMMIYFILVYFVEKKKGLLEKVKDTFSSDKTHVVEDILKILIGIVIVFLTSRFIVNQTVYFSQLLKIPLFLVSFLILPFGTNLPEFSLAARSIIAKKKEIAFGDYLGSAAANSFLFGFLTLLNGKRINVSRYSMITLILMLFSFLLFYFFSRSKNEISKEEGKILLLTYLLFVLVEVFI